MGTIHTDTAGDQGGSDGGKLGRQPLPGKREPGTGGSAGLDSFPGGVTGNPGDPFQQFGGVAAPFPGGQTTVPQFIPGRLRDLSGGQHPQRVYAPAGPFGRGQHRQQGRPRTGRPSTRGSSTAASCQHEGTVAREWRPVRGPRHSPQRCGGFSGGRMRVDGGHAGIFSRASGSNSVQAARSASAGAAGTLPAPSGTGMAATSADEMAERDGVAVVVAPDNAVALEVPKV